MPLTVLVDREGRIAISRARVVYYQEFFSPAALIFRVKNDREAAKLANDSPYRLGGSIITKDIERGKRIAPQIDTGIVFINQATWTAQRPAVRRGQEFRLRPRTLQPEYRRIREQKTDLRSVILRFQPLAMARRRAQLESILTMYGCGL